MARHLIRNATTGQMRIVGTAALPFFANQGFVELDQLDDGLPAFSYPTLAEGDLRYVNVTELNDPQSPASVALRAALETWVEADDYTPTGLWDFVQAPTVGGQPIGTGGGATSDAALRPNPFAAPDGPAPVMVAQANRAGHGWTNSGTTGTVNLDDTSDTAFGSQCITMTTAGTGATTTHVTKAGLSFTLSGRDPVIWVRVDGLANLSRIELRIGEAAFASFHFLQVESASGASVAARYVRDGKWARIAIPRGAFEAPTGDPSGKTMAQVRITPVDNGSGPVTVKVAGVGYQPTPPQSFVSFTLDDGWIEQWTLFRPILDQYGWPATALPIVDILGLANYMTVAQLKTLQDRHGWEIGAHAYHGNLHTQAGGYTVLTAAALDAELKQLKAWLIDNGFNGRDYFAYPQGLYNDDTLAVVGKYFAAARTQNEFRRETLPVSDKLRTRTINLGSGITLATAKARIDEVVANREWINFTCHRLHATTVDGSTWLTADFQALCDYIASKGLAVRTYGQVLRSVGEPYAVSTDARRIQRTTQAAYDALATKDPNTLYLIPEAL